MATLQIEFDRQRVGQFGKDGLCGIRNENVIADMFCRALRDTLRNGGTFVLVVSDTTVTAIQHPEAKPLED